jgi:2-phosphoglycerate kinase
MTAETKDANIYIITGPAGVGKSTVSKEVAKRFNSSSFIEGDFIYHMIIGGYVNPWEDTGEYMDLLWQNIAGLSLNFVEKKITTVLDYIVFPEHLKKLMGLFDRKNLKVKYIVLISKEDELIKRDGERILEHRMGKRVLELLNEFRRLKIESKYIIDTTEMCVDDIVNMIIADDRFDVSLQ